MARFLSSLFDIDNDWYDTIEFKKPDAFYNAPAPDPWVAWWMGIVLGFLTLLYWYVLRWRPVRQDQEHALHLHPTHLAIRTVIATLSDNDDPTFTLLRLGSQAFLFLGGFQTHYEMTLTVMLIYYFVISCGDSVRVLLAMHSCDTVENLVVVAKKDKALLSKVETKQGKITIDLSAGNVYEDLSRSWVLVVMVFVTQCLLITFFVTDLYKAGTMTTLDGTAKVPIVGTMGSWMIFILGGFIQAVYLLGPKCSFGTSEQNPHFWMQFLISAKHTGAQVTWRDPLYNTECHRVLRPNDAVLWCRFCASHLINGFGFHILVHALPIQVAGQSSLTSVVFRAVGMLYLVDLDDAPGTKLTIQESIPVVPETPTVKFGITDSTMDFEETDQNTTVEKPGMIKKDSMQLQMEETQRQLQSIQKQLASMMEENRKKNEPSESSVSPQLNPYEIAMITGADNGGSRSIAPGGK
jgi:hypothetical protein